ncbi:pectinesterase inhibitor-like [Cucumis melo var. makuwa]|uniref:Pectinesterase inhibitor-like n=1 Tax=Cucumis melo var. makuwa TaxID=1194695 RepID=A0A5D3CKK7_CUCMM|nr:pectinesterase inhibitor-like [Cucumis melo var. makuwa]
MQHHLPTSFPPSVQKPQNHNFVQSYDGAVGDIENAQKDLAIGDFTGVNIVTSGAMTEIDDCQDKFVQPPKDTSLLLKNGKTLKDICNIILPPHPSSHRPPFAVQADFVVVYVASSLPSTRSPLYTTELQPAGFSWFIPAPAVTRGSEPRLQAVHIEPCRIVSLRSSRRRCRTSARSRVSANQNLTRVSSPKPLPHALSTRTAKPDPRLFSANRTSIRAYTRACKLYFIRT